MYENLDYITTGDCDGCNYHGPAVVCHHNGTPVIAQCSSCAPRAFEAAARRDINSWLEGRE